MMRGDEFVSIKGDKESIMVKQKKNESTQNHEIKIEKEGEL